MHVRAADLGMRKLLEKRWLTLPAGEERVAR